MVSDQILKLITGLTKKKLAIFDYWARKLGRLLNARNEQIHHIVIGSHGRYYEDGCVNFLIANRNARKRNIKVQYIQ